MKMLDDFLLFEEHSINWTKNTQKCPKQKEAQQIFFSLVTNTTVECTMRRIEIKDVWFQ